MASNYFVTVNKNGNECGRSLPHLGICLDGLRKTTKTLSVNFAGAPAETVTEHLRNIHITSVTNWISLLGLTMLSVSHAIKMSGHLRVRIQSLSSLTIEEKISNNKLSTRTLNFTEHTIKVECALSTRFVYSHLQIPLLDCLRTKTKMSIRHTSKFWTAH
jgi:hypothetical protein